MTMSLNKPLRDEYLIYCDSAPIHCYDLNTALTVAKDKARQHPRFAVRVYKLIAEARSEVQEPAVAFTE